MADFEDNWVTRAMADDTLVAYVLLSFTRPSLNLRWSSRQRRYKLAGDKKGEPSRDSPTTPLSWGGATSGCDGFEESTSRQAKPVDVSRSNKVGDQNETAMAKKRRKRWTLPELLEEEKRLLKEKTDLKYELASMHLIVEEHRATNKSLKRIKLDLASRHTSKIAPTPPVSGIAVLDPPQPVDAQCDPSKSVSPQVVQEQDKVLDDELLISTANAYPEVQEISNQELKFLLLPDLNLPVEEEDVNSNDVPPEIS